MDFEQASKQVRRLMEIAGGSSDAYEETPTPEKPQHVDWEAACAQVSRLITPAKPTPAPVAQVGEEPASDEPSGQELEDFFRELKGEKPFVPPTEKELTELPAIDCGGVIEGMPRGSSPLTPLPDYREAGSVDDAGELFDLYHAFLHVIQTQRPEDVQLESGQYTILKAMGAWALCDSTKNLKYILDANPHQYSAEFQVDDLLIWVRGISDGGEDYGYIWNGWCYLRK